ncbi:MAG: ABC transporter ATP-binding protein [Patescibacteria group bacterium]
MILQKQLLTIKNLKKDFTTASQQSQILKGVSLEINDGDFLIIYGPSGCGKSTFLHVLLGLEKPSSGNVLFREKNLYSLSEDQRADLRKKTIGMVYQQSYWIQSRTVLQNVAFPLTLLGFSREKAYQKAKEKLQLMGMIDWQNHFPTELSSGQQQRVAVARAIINEPDLIVTDEPTGNLDSKASVSLMNILKQLNQSGKTIIMVTHDLEFLGFGSRVIKMSDGLIVSDGDSTSVDVSEIAKNGKRNIDL